MNKYNCTVIFDASVNVTIEADTPEDAADQAENETQGRQNLCHQCSNELDTGESIGVLVYNDEYTDELLDTRYNPQRTWVGLTDVERHEIMVCNYARTELLAHAIESKLKEKNS